ncbi:MAG: hypothetical protein ACTSXY_12255 [Promethearchaeota archaeon]
MAKRKNEPTIRADDFVDFEGAEKPENFTNFQELQTRVQILKEQLDEIAEILRQNNIVRKKIIEAPYFDEDEVYKRLDDGE